MRGFERVRMEPNETKTVRMRLKAEALSYWDEKLRRFVVEPEPVNLLVGPSSAGTKLKARIQVLPRVQPIKR